MIRNINPAHPLIVLGLAAASLASLFLLAIRLVQMPDAHTHAMHAAAGERPATIVRPLSCENLADIPGKAVTTATVTFPPNAYTPAHRHPGSVTAYVLKGAVRSQLSGSPTVTYRPGDTWFEPNGTLHLFAENASATEHAELLAIFIADENCGPLVIPEK
jgi:quercetin dioxygenase-like cupin family protein